MHLNRAMRSRSRVVEASAGNIHAYRERVLPLALLVLGEYCHWHYSYSRTRRVLPLALLVLAEWRALGQLPAEYPVRVRCLHPAGAPPAARFGIKPVSAGCRAAVHGQHGTCMPAAGCCKSMSSTVRVAARMYIPRRWFA